MGFGNTAASYMTTKDRTKAIALRRMVRKEGGWNNNIVPISKFNSKVHPS